MIKQELDILTRHKQAFVTSIKQANKQKLIYWKLHRDQLIELTYFDLIIVLKERENPAEEACDMINVAIGQTELLINKKFRQFQELINMCETGNSEKPVQCLDLHGFWDMITIQVINILFKVLAFRIYFYFSILDQ